VSKMSGTQSRILDIEEDIQHLSDSFQNALSELKLQSQKQASQQKLHEDALAEILALLKGKTNPMDGINNIPSDRDNLPSPLHDTGGSDGAAGSGEWLLNRPCGRCPNAHS
jgi:hypothetical protein